MSLKKSEPVTETITARAPRGIPLKLCFLHQAITWPGVAGSEKTLSEMKIKGVKMYWIPEAVVLECKGQKLLIPHANVSCAVVDNEAVARALSN